jgi:hypothetical protein
MLMVAREVPADDRRSRWVVALSFHGRTNINIDAIADSMQTAQ